MKTIILLHNKLVKGIQIKYLVTKKLSIPMIFMKIYLPALIPITGDDIIAGDLQIIKKKIKKNSNKGSKL